MLNSTHKKDQKQKKGDKDGKALKDNAVYGKTMENLRNRVDVKPVSNKKDYLKWKSILNPKSKLYVSQDI